MAERDPYEVLGVEPDASDEDARAAWRRLVSIYHPDQRAHKPEDVRAEAERRMAGVNEAYQSIVRGERRAVLPDPPPPASADPTSTARGPESRVHAARARHRRRHRRADQPGRGPPVRFVLTRET